MAKINQLSALKIAKLAKKPGRYADGLNLYLLVRRPGDASWVFRYMLAGKSRDLGLGPLHSVSLLEARVRGREARQVILDGRDPLTAKRDAAAAQRLQELKTVTFAQAVEQFLATAKVESFKNDKHRKQWRSTLASVFPVIGNLPLQQIDTATVLAALLPVWKRTPETGSRLRSRLARVFDWAAPLGLFDGPNPAAWDRLKDNLPVKPRAVHHAAMPYADVPAFMAKLRERDSVSARALEFTILTATRSGDVLGAKWSDIDLKAGGVWNIPVTKTGKPHRVPLSDRAVEILRNLELASKPKSRTDFVFINGNAKPLSNAAMHELLKGMVTGVTPHGFRTSFRTWAEERTSFDHHTKETALAHVTHQSKVEQAYNRSDAFNNRGKLMAKWASYCAGRIARTGGNVVSIRSA